MVAKRFCTLYFGSICPNLAKIHMVAKPIGFGLLKINGPNLAKIHMVAKPHIYK